MYFGKPDDASDGLAGAHYDYAFATQVTRATVAFIAKRAGYLGVADASMPLLADSDGDGYFDEIETVLLSDPALSSSTPKGLAAATPSGSLETTGMVVALDFVNTGGDVIAVSGIWADSCELCRDGRAGDCRRERCCEIFYAD